MRPLPPPKGSVCGSGDLEWMDPCIARESILLQSEIMPTPPVILAIESSCDDTGVAVIRGREVLANAIANQAVHERYGGVVPELASRAHAQNIVPTLESAMQTAGIQVADIDAVAYTRGPGLMGSLHVGTAFAKTWAWAHGLPMVPVNHMQAHILAHFLDPDPAPAFPFLCLTVSGGHTQLVRVDAPLEMTILGETKDDAAGEAFDKGAALMGLGYPGGPQIQKLAQAGDADAIALPEPRLKDKDCHFSFSGLKTAFAQSYQRLSAAEQTEARADYAASLQHAIAKALIRRVRYAMERYRQEIGLSDGTARLVVAGGVAANLHIRSELEKLADAHDFELSAPPVSLCVDNGAMIAWVGQEYHKAGMSDGFDTPPRPRWPLDKNAAPPPGRGVRG